MKKNNLNKNESGYAVLVSVMTVVALASLFSVGFVFTVVESANIARDEVDSTQSYYAAEAGIEDSIHRIRNGKLYSTSNVFFVGGATSTISIIDTSGVISVTVEGIKNNLHRKQFTNFELSADRFDFFYGIQAGDLGAVFEEDSMVVGNVYSNGSVSGHNDDGSDSVITGDLTVAGSTTEDPNIAQTVCNTDQIVGQADPKIDFAQSFTTGVTGDTLSRVSLYIKKVGNPDKRKIKITADDGGKPADNDLEEGELDKNLVGTSYGWVNVILDNPLTLSANTKYWIVLDAKKNNSKYWIWCKDSADSYAGGSAAYSKKWKDDPWTTESGDLTFKTGFGSSGLADEVVVYGDIRANTITNSKICGDAYYQSIDVTSLAFLNNPTNPPCPLPLTLGTGYPASPDPIPAPMPIYDSIINQWKAEAQAGGTITGNYDLTADVSLGPIEITGDLLMSSANKTLTVTGVIYVHGNFDMSNNSNIQCDSSFGANSCIIVNDGWIHIDKNGTFAGSGSSNSFLMLATTLNCDGSGLQTGCTDHDGAVDVHEDSDIKGAVIYAPYGMINIHKDVQMTQVTGYKLRADKNVVITYDSGLPSASFSSGPSAGWRIYNWQEIQ